MNRTCGRLLATAALLIAPLASIASAQAGPEVKKLEYLVGKWRTEVEIKATAGSPAVKGTGSETCEWFANLHVVCRAETTTAAGLYTTHRTVSWVPALKQYSVYTIDSYGYAVLTLAQIQGNTWTMMSEIAGTKSRSTMKTSGDSYTTASEYAGADGKWIPTATVKATRQK